MKGYVGVMGTTTAVPATFAADVFSAWQNRRTGAGEGIAGFRASRRFEKPICPQAMISSPAKRPDIR